MAAVIITHDLGVVAKMAERVIVMLRRYQSGGGEHEPVVRKPSASLYGWLVWRDSQRQADPRLHSAEGNSGNGPIDILHSERLPLLNPAARNQ